MKKQEMKSMTVEQFHAAIREQGAPSSKQSCFTCPMCGTVQNMVDLINAGAGKTEEDVNRLIGFSCVGRWTHHKPPAEVKGQQIGCNWTLGGLFSLHNFEVIDDEGKRNPHFALSTREQTAVHLLEQAMLREAV
jgi:hypothetical protein